MADLFATGIFGFAMMLENSKSTRSDQEDQREQIRSNISDNRFHNKLCIENMQKYEFVRKPTENVGDIGFLQGQSLIIR